MQWAICSEERSEDLRHKQHSECVGMKAQSARCLNALSAQVEQKGVYLSALQADC